MDDPETPETLFACDAGNTTLKWAAWSGGAWGRPLRVSAQEEGLQERLVPALREWGPAPSEAGRCVVASVRPSLTEVLQRSWERAGGRVEMEFFERDVEIPLETDVRCRRKVGVDRLLCALAAVRRVGSPCIIVSVGSAIVVDAVDASGTFVGGAIAPGFRLSARSLARDTECLTEVEPQAPDGPIGSNTEDAMRSGLYWMCRGGAAELVRRQSADLGGDVPVVVTGGDAELLLPLPGTDRAEHTPHLLFHGITAALGLC